MRHAKQKTVYVTFTRTHGPRRLASWAPAIACKMLMQTGPFWVLRQGQNHANLSTVSVMPPASGAFASTSYHDDSHLNLMGRRAPQSALSVSIPTFTRAPQSSFNVSQSFNISETSSISGKLIRVRPSSAAVIIPTAKLNRPMLQGGDAVVATYLPAQVPATRQGSGALVVGTIVAGLPLSASLPKMSAVKADLVPLGVGSPSIPKRRHPASILVRFKIQRQI